MPSTTATTATRASQFGDLLRRHRQTAGLTQAELAERAGLSVRGINDLERGVRQSPRKDTVALLAAALRLTEEERTTFEAAARAAPTSTSPPAPQPGARGMRPHSALPLPPTPLIGREREEAAVTHLVRQQGARLLTLTGAPGIGKTRLALQVAAGLHDTFAEGVIVVGLAAIQDPTLVLATLAQALGVHDTGDQPLRETLVAHLRERHLLLVLDNFEQVVAAAPQLADLLARCPQLTLLVTSRTALRLRGEQEFAVPALALPDPGPLLPAEELLQYAAVALFVQRARAVRPTFALTATLAPAIVAICRRLDGLPLALELAAARIKLFAPPDLLRRLEHSLSVLTGGAQDLPERQRTLRSAIAWSYDLLPETEQRLFRRLAVFVGGWTLEAALAVCSGPGVPSGAVLEGLGRLVDQSLVVVMPLSGAGAGDAGDVEEGDETRFALLETLREYALEQLEASGEGEAIRRRHAEYLIRWVGHSARVGPGLRLRENVLARELANARVALIWARDRGEDALGLHLAAAFGQTWFIRGLTGEGRAWLEDMLARNAGADEQAVPVSVRLMALFGASECARSQGDYAQAEDWARECLDLARRAGDLSAAGSALTILAATAQGRGDLARATDLYEESLMRYREAGTEDGIGRAMINLGNLWVMRGNYARALPLLEEVLAHGRSVGSSFAIANGLNSLANAARAQGDFRRAAALHLESLPLYREIGNKGYVALCLEGLAAARLGEGRYKDSACLCAAAATLRAEAHAPLPKPEQEAYDRTVAAARAALGNAVFAEAWASGRALSLEEAIAESLGEAD